MYTASKMAGSYMGFWEGGVEIETQLVARVLLGTKISSLTTDEGGREREKFLQIRRTAQSGTANSRSHAKGKEPFSDTDGGRGG